MKGHLEVRIFPVCLTVAIATAACAQHYPGKPVRIVTQSAGGGTDIIARLVAQGIALPLGQPVIVENRGSAVVPGEIVARSVPDGHTLLELANSFWLGPYLQRNVPYDPVKDFAPITLLGGSPQILVVHPSVAAHSVKELIALSASRPGQLNYASGTNGGSPHLAAELFKSMAGVNIVRIPYQGSGPATNDLIAGHVQLIFGPAASVMPHVLSGKLRALAVTTAEPSLVAPDLPTVAASGLPGYETGTLYGMFAPAGTPASIISRLNFEIVRFLRTASTRERFLRNGVDVKASTPGEFAKVIQAEMAKMRKLITDAGIRGEQ